MKIAISGATGFIGTRLRIHLSQQGHTTVVLTREIINEFAGDTLRKIINDSDVVINLAGAPINHYWSEVYKKELYDSRIITTHKIVDAINKGHRCRLLISASAVGYYPDSGCYDEDTATSGDSFLAELCKAWEGEARKVNSPVRLVISRFGIVFAPSGGAFEQMARPAKLGVATAIGYDEQPFSWIDIEDLARAMEFVINHDSLNGIVNFTAPESITQHNFTQQLAVHYMSWASITAPKVIFRVLYGQASEFITQEHCVYPKRLLMEGFKFISPDIKSFIRRIR